MTIPTPKADPQVGKLHSIQYDKKAKLLSWALRKSFAQRPSRAASNRLSCSLITDLQTFNFKPL